MKTNDFLGNTWEIDCMGCAICDGSMQVPGGFIYKGSYFCVHQDPLIPLPGFLVIASLRHIRSLAEMDAAEYEEFAKLLRAAHTAIKAVTHIEHLTLIQEESSNHFHLWFFPWTQAVLDRYGAPSLAKVRAIMADYRQQPLDDAGWQPLKESIEEMRALPVWRAA